MNWFESIIYGLLSGLTEFLPLSSSAHQQIYLQLCGEATHDPARDLFVHIGLLLAIQIASRPMLVHLRRINGGSKRIGTISKIAYDSRFVKAAALPMLVMFFILTYIFRSGINLIWTSLILVLNGLILFLPDRLVKGNKDAGAMSSLDSLLFGVAGALSAIPGFSGLGMSVSVASIRGADRQNAIKWALLLSITTLWALILTDIIRLFSGYGISDWKNLLLYFLSAISAFGAGYCGIKFIRFISTRQNYSIFSYYCWGAALIAFFLYLTVV